MPNLGGRSAAVHDLVDAIFAAAPGAVGSITISDEPVAGSTDANNDGLVELVREIPETPLGDGVERTIRSSRRLISPV